MIKNIFFNENFFQGIYIEEERFLLSCSADDDNDNKIQNNSKNIKNIPRNIITRRKIMSLSDLPKWPKKSKKKVYTENHENNQIQNNGSWKNLNSENSEVSNIVKNCNYENVKMKKKDLKEMDAYHRVLKSIFYRKNKNEYFPSVEEVALQWKIFDDILNFINVSNNDNIANTCNDNNNSNDDISNNIENENNNNNNNNNNNDNDRSNYSNNDSQSSTNHIVLRTYNIGSTIESITER